MKRWVKSAAGMVVLGTLFSIAGCTGLPSRVQPVGHFRLARYLGRWYEIARIDHSFEKGLTHVQALYLPMDDGGVQVVNEGFDPHSRQWSKAMGRAYPMGGPREGRLKVAFFGPFYSSYNIIALDHRDYQWAMVCGPNHNYLWILSRSPRLNPSVKARLLDQARASGFEVDRLTWVEQSTQVPPPPY